MMYIHVHRCHAYVNKEIYQCSFHSAVCQQRWDCRRGTVLQQSRNSKSHDISGIDSAQDCNGTLTETTPCPTFLGSIIGENDGCDTTLP